MQWSIDGTAFRDEHGRPDEGYLGWLREQVETCRRHGLHVVLDAHQDLYAQAHSDGAPGWATLTDHPFDATSLWSDAYLSSPAVHEALDAFWANAQVAGRGLQDHFAEFWLAVLDAVGKEPAVVALDLFNETGPHHPRAARRAAAALATARAPGGNGAR